MFDDKYDLWWAVFFCILSLSSFYHLEEKHGALYNLGVSVLFSVTFYFCLTASIKDYTGGDGSE